MHVSIWKDVSSFFVHCWYYFDCCFTYIFVCNKLHVYRGECEGLIHDKLEGENGFGYDPIFYYPPFNTTLANVSEEKKNSVSHRGVALEKFLKDWSK